jgi:lipopolysaccharide export system permease protein
MKILDRYVLRMFLYNYLISFMVLIGMYIVLDMVFNFDELVEHKENVQISNVQIIQHIATYYFYQTFLIFVHLSGIIPVVAAAFTLIRLSRFNELSAILAAGIPLLRVAAPIIIASVVLQGLLAVDQELIIPNIIPHLVKQHDDVVADSGGKTFPIQAMQDERKGLIFAGRYNPMLNGTATMTVVDVIERDNEGRTIGHITADRAEWDDQARRWKLTNGRRSVPAAVAPRDHRNIERRVNEYKSNVTPDEISLYHSGEYVNFLSLRRIEQLLSRPQIYGTIDLLRVKHFRLLQLVMNVLMVLVAIPCVLVRDPSRLKLSIMTCLILVGLCMVSYFVAYQIAGNPRGGPEWQDRWPVMVALGPLLIFGLLAVVLLDRLATKNT